MSIRKHLVLISDLGHTGPIWPQILDGLASKNWKVTVISPRLSRAQIKFFGLKYTTRKWQLIQTNQFLSPYRKFAGYSKFLRFLLLVFSKKNSPDEIKAEDFFGEYRDWKTPALEELTKLNTKEPIDIILSSSSPFATHIIAQEFSRINHLPWIADYRDLWSLNHSREEFDKDMIIFERQLLLSANLCITTSYGFRNKLSELYYGPIFVIQNGYHLLFPGKAIKKSTPIEILYPGQIYKNLQDIRPIIFALQELNLGTNVFFTLKISGYAISHVKCVLTELGIKDADWIKFGKVLPLKKSLALQRNTDFLLLLNCIKPNIEGWMQTKLYEYVASGTPIIAFGGTGFDESSMLIKKLNTGYVIPDKEQLVKFLQKVMFGKQENYSRDEEGVQKLSRFNQGVLLGKILKDLT